MADGGSPISASLTLSVKIGYRTYDHDLLVVPSTKSAMLIGVHLWAKTPIVLPAPPTGCRTRKISKCVVTQPGLASRTVEEELRLNDFLVEDLTTSAGQPIAAPIRIKPGVQSIKQRYRPRNPAVQAIINQKVEKMEREGIIEPVHRAWSSPIVIVKKKDGSYRFCIDFRPVNDVTE